MPEAEKQEGQKTVVAFITGLLIGGLLVWVFSSSPDQTPNTDTDEETTEESATNTNNNGEASVIDATNDDDSNVSSNGNGSINVDDQAAGGAVNLGKLTYPDTNGWVVVRDYANGVGGRILGAARYSTDAGLLPTRVSLLRDTVAGKTYQVMFYTENGDKKFSTASDMMVPEGATTFTAK
jgi:hypothetical protein